MNLYQYETTERQYFAVLGDGNLFCLGDHGDLEAAEATANDQHLDWIFVIDRATAIGWPKLKENEMTPNREQIKDIRKNEQARLLGYITKNFASDDAESISEYVAESTKEWQNFYSAKEAATQAQQVMETLGIKPNAHLTTILKWFAAHNDYPH